MFVLDSTGVYTELDVLLDTRIATLASIDNQLAESVLSSGEYHTRLEDKFGTLSVAEFYVQYNQRDGAVLMNSMMTNAFILIRHLFQTMATEEVQTRQHKDPVLYVNTYPYEIDKDVMAVLRRAIEHNLMDMADVNFVHYSPKTLTPQLCKNDFRFMLMYDWNSWMNAQSDEFQKLAQAKSLRELSLLPEVTLLAPALYFNGKPSETEEKEYMVELRKHLPGATSIFDAPEKLASMITNLNLIDVYYFSIVSDFDQSAYTSTLPDLASLRRGSGRST